MSKNVTLEINSQDIEFICKSILGRSKVLTEYILSTTKEQLDRQIEMEEREEKQLKLLESKNKDLKRQLDLLKAKEKAPFELTPERIRVLKEAGFWTKQADEEIKDVEMDEFQADIKEMLEKHQPKRRSGRPMGSKNKVKANAK